MSALRSLTSGVGSLPKEQAGQELDEELNGFIEMAAEEKMKEGASRKDALREVRLERGSLEVTKEEVRTAGWESRVEALWRDLRYSTRQLRANPLFTAAALLSLALGIGANTAVFQWIDAVRLRTLPVRNPQEIANAAIDRGVASRAFASRYRSATDLAHAMCEQFAGRRVSPKSLRGDQPFSVGGNAGEPASRPPCFAE